MTCFSWLREGWMQCSICSYSVLLLINCCGVHGCQVSSSHVDNTMCFSTSGRRYTELRGSPC